MFEIVCVLLGIIDLACHGPTWLGILLLAMGGIWFVSDGDIDLF